MITSLPDTLENDIENKIEKDKDKLKEITTTLIGSSYNLFFYLISIR